MSRVFAYARVSTFDQTPENQIREIETTGFAGKMTMNVINAVAQFERDLLIERTQSGLARAKAEGKVLGRPSALSGGQKIEVKEKIKNGEAISAIARHFETSRQTIMRVRDQA